jgi:chaperonin cofactor prefoldin
MLGGRSNPPRAGALRSHVAGKEVKTNMDNDQTNQLDQRLQGIETRIARLEAQGTKLDRLIYKLFKRLPRKTGEMSATPAEIKTV